MTTSCLTASRHTDTMGAMAPKSPAEIQKAYRDRRRGAPPRQLEPCGTLAAWRRHQRHGEAPCPPCVEARRAYDAGRDWSTKREG